MPARLIAVACVLLATTLHLNATADDAALKNTPIWITVVQPPQAEDEEARFVVQVTDGAEFKLVEAIARTIPAVSGDGMQLLPSPQVDLTFRTDAFLVMKISGNRLTLAPGSRFPFSITRSLAKELAELGFEEATIESPEKLLVRKSSGDPFARAFAFRDATTPRGDSSPR